MVEETSALFIEGKVEGNLIIIIKNAEIQMIDHTYKDYLWKFQNSQTWLPPNKVWETKCNKQKAQTTKESPRSIFPIKIQMIVHTSGLT